MLTTACFAAFCFACACAPSDEANDIREEIRVQEEQNRKDDEETERIRREYRELRLKTGKSTRAMGGPRAPAADLPPALRVKFEILHAAESLAIARGGLVAAMQRVDGAESLLRKRDGASPSPPDSRVVVPPANTQGAVSDKAGGDERSRGALEERIAREVARLHRDELTLDRARRDVWDAIGSEAKSESLDDAGRTALERGITSAREKADRLYLLQEIWAARARVILGMKAVNTWNRRLGELKGQTSTNKGGKGDKSNGELGSGRR